jgi:hypothetical protein
MYDVWLAVANGRCRVKRQHVITTLPARQCYVLDVVTVAPTYMRINLHLREPSCIQGDIFKSPKLGYITGKIIICITVYIYNCLYTVNYNYKYLKYYKDLK